MAGGNRRGPDNQGPLTGRGLGFCAGNDQPGWSTDAPRRGWAGSGRGGGFGRGRGRGRRRGDLIGAETRPQNDIQSQLDDLRHQLQQISSRLAGRQGESD